MGSRRTVAPDMVGCCFLLYAGTLLFAVMRAPYVHRTVAGVATDIAIYGGLLLCSAAVAMGLFQRRSAAWGPAILLSACAIAAGAMAFHVPETAQLPAGVLGGAGIVLLWASRGEFAADSSAARSGDSARKSAA